ncbi:MAG: RNA methyltransferase [Saprospiraceae bacterium]
MEFSKNNVKLIRSLQIKKFRDKFNKFIAEGDKICLEMLRNPNHQIEGIFTLADWAATKQALLKRQSVRASIITSAEMKVLSALKTPANVLIVAKKPDQEAEKIQLSQQWTLYLDGIQDPGNLGTILRIADWFGLAAVFCSEDSADVYNNKVIQSSMGAFLRVPVFRKNLNTIRTEQSVNFPIYGAAMEGANILEIENLPPGMIIMGNEGQGIRPEKMEMIDSFIHIPKGGSGGAESLNVGVACGIICAQLARLKDR